MTAMQELMASLRRERPREVAGLRVLRFSDYLSGEQTELATGLVTPIQLPKSNVLSFGLENNAGLIIRPSGTEPKIKAYITSTGRNFAEADAMNDTLRAAAEVILKP